MTKYTDDQVSEAIQKAAAKNTPGPVYAWELSMYKKVIDALPEPQGDWQECTFTDIRKGDRVKRVNPLIGDATETIEGTAVTVDENWALTKGGTTLAHSRDTNKPDLAIYRIPAPVQHPDPKEYPVIANVAVHKPGTNSTHRYDYATWDIGEYYDCWSNDGKYYGAWRPSAIVEWSPAKVVADND